LFHVELINQMFVDQSELFFLLSLFRPKEGNCFAQPFTTDDKLNSLLLPGVALLCRLPRVIDILPFQGNPNHSPKSDSSGLFNLEFGN